MAQQAAQEQPQSGFKTKNLVIIGLVIAAIWGLAIYSHSTVFLIIVGVLTAIVAAIFLWAIRLMGKQKKLASLLQGATASPEARAAAIAKLSAGKDANDIVNVIARAQLVAQDDPAAALAMLEKYELKEVPVQLQDDYAVFRSQLYLQFGRPKDARPLVDKINFDNFDTKERRQARGMVAAVMAEAWGRTDRSADALALIDKIDLDKEDPQIKLALLVARTFAHFAARKKQDAKADLEEIAAIDVNQLGRFVMPRFKVHPELQKLARQVAERNPQVRKMSQPKRGGHNIRR